MSYSCENYVKDENGTKFFIGDKVRVYRKGEWQFYGTITLITGKGIYVACGGKRDKYLRADILDEIEIVEEE
ncbi:hypothetical protein IAI10_02165 [Clostridium sp. 19966]|uniref:hypothetical protein n=1 Tax=Clostridium sp. 19966 TaxID=2768166 RepID=UPI0028DDADCE|nr:hypothetical protein [Clostridium sp. 19966]MDT8715462.1 hypothetical protein [Clostridium sp. 19966]